jgi:branched-chain amino acid transport system substrate-binding protein
MTWFQRRLALYLMAVMLLNACVPAIKLPFSLPNAQKPSCQAIPIGIVIGAEDVPDAQDQQEGYELAAKEINQAGGIQGCPIRLVYNRSEGEGTNPDAVQAAMLEMADGGEVAVLGATNSAATKRIVAIAQYIKIPVVITPDTPDDLMVNASAWIFRINPANKTYAGAAFDMVKDKLSPTANVAILYDQTEYGESAATTAGDAVLNRGLSLVSYVGYDSATVDFTAQLSQVRNTNPNALYAISSNAKQAQAILAGIKSLNLNIPLIIGNGSGFSAHEFLYNQAGKLNSGLDGLTLTVPWSSDLKGRTNQDFNQRLAAFRKASRETAAYPAVVATVQAYTAMHLLADALTDTAKASPRDWKAILASPDQLASYRGELAQTLRGYKAAQHNTMLGQIEFDADGQNGATGVIDQVISGSLVTVYPQASAAHALILSGR